MKCNFSQIKSFCKVWADQGYKALSHEQLHQSFYDFIENWVQSSTYDLNKWHEFTKSFAHELEQSVEQIKSDAPRANIIHVLNLGYDEIRHSRMLAWLLDKNATHMQGDLFFKNFLSLLNLEKKGYEKYEYEVEREKPDRIDISIYSINNFAIYIENKVRHHEREYQLDDEYISLHKWSKKWNILRNNRHLVFLTPGGYEPLSLTKFPGESINISWIGVANEIKKAAFSDNCLSNYIRRLSINYSDQVAIHANKLIKRADNNE